jgi:hypothetical protein
MIIKERCAINVPHFKEIFEWLWRNNPHYTSYSGFHECPCPIVLDDGNSIDEESENPTMKDNWKFNIGCPV